MAALEERTTGAPAVAVDLVEPGAHARRGRLRCQLGENVAFNPAHLESYCFAPWDPIVYDTPLVAAAVDFADRSQRRPASTWRREIALRIPVHDPARWTAKPVADALLESLCFLTGDDWEITFHSRHQPLQPPPQGRFSLPGGVTAVIPFSNGLSGPRDPAAGLSILVRPSQLSSAGSARSDLVPSATPERPLLLFVRLIDCQELEHEGPEPGPLVEQLLELVRAPG